MKRGVFPGHCYDLLMTLHHTGVSCARVYHLHKALRVYIGYYLAFCIAVGITWHGVKIGNAMCVGCVKSERVVERAGMRCIDQLNEEFL
jgi:hypothetical protein